ncbi:prolyl 4-hydroxylase subunit alpha-1-like [Styela clava]|uniref:prolyl 4-hydroxylase subunit alpha-1-like n=1 Tax=Styela clava TaxID=7725 RepID=UPI001939449C|nr:prolyl 4-hydroxylase subunit alpha-1-like [Styela clava]
MSKMRNNIQCLVFIVSLSTLTRAKNDAPFTWYSTIGEMNNLTALENKLLMKLETKIWEGKERIHEVQKKLQLLRESREEMLKWNDKNSQRTLIIDYQKSWPEFDRKLIPFIDEVFHLEALQTIRNFPSVSDMEAVSLSLLLLQKSYNLNATDISEGYISGNRAGKRLRFEACGYLALKSCERTWESLCRDWVHVSLRRLESGETAEDITKEVLESLVETISEKEEFKKICAGQGTMQSHKRQRENLYCQMWDNYKHPWLILQPVRMEIHSISPDVVQFYDIISEENIELLKSLSMHQLASAKTMALETKIDVDSHRVAHHCWLSKRNNTILEYLDVLVSAITGLQVSKSAEQLQVANYGIGGHYDPHTDYLDYSAERELKSRNRKATFMFYLSDVAKGGATAFLYPGIRVHPVKRSAVFWNNLLPSGHPDNRTTHGSCPVLLGDKWVANKWIRETRNEVCKTTEYIGRLH